MRHQHIPAGILKAGLCVSAMLWPLAAAADQFDRVRRDVADLMAAENLASISVAVSRDGKVLWEQGFGWSDRDRRIAATARTPYALASISKVFTATAVMALAERGQVNLDAPVNDYLGAHKVGARLGDARDATLRRLADHTSGLPDFSRFYYEGEKLEPLTMEQGIERFGVLMRPPGEAYVYSSLGFGILGYVLERVSGQSYAMAMDSLVFKPLGLQDSAVGPPPSGDARAAVRYSKSSARIPRYWCEGPASADVMSSAHDLLSFGMFHLKDDLPGRKPALSHASIDAMQVATAKDPSDSNGKGARGFGWGLHEIEGLRIVSHAGYMPGVSSQLTLAPDHDIAIVVLANGQSRRLSEITNEIMRLVRPQTAAATDGFEAPASLQGTWSGSAQTSNGKVPVMLDIRAGGRVFAQIGTGPVTEVLEKEVSRDGTLSLDGVEGDIGTADAAVYPYTLEFSLVKRGEVLGGNVKAHSRPMLDRIGNLLPYWVELRR